jgi:hypothetical protein
VHELFPVRAYCCAPNIYSAGSIGVISVTVL